MVVEAFLRSPLVRQLIEDGCKTAAREGRDADVRVYRLIGDQVANAR
jgi:hypothetical protein